MNKNQSAHMKILIINLDSETHRMDFQQAQMKVLGLVYQRLRATRKADLPADQLDYLTNQWERPMRVSEVACLFSHAAAWQIIANGTEPVLVLEDDALLSSRTPEILKALKTLEGLDHVTLEVRGRKKILAKKARALTDEANLVHLYKDRSGAGAYVLWPNGAQILLDNSAKKPGLSDAVIARSYQLSSWQVEPAPAMQLDQCDKFNLDSPIETTSAIGSSATHKPRPNGSIATLKFKIRRILSQIRMGLRQLRSSRVANRRYVAVEIRDFEAHILAIKQQL